MGRVIGGAAIVETRVGTLEVIPGIYAGVAAKEGRSMFEPIP